MVLIVDNIYGSGEKGILQEHLAGAIQDIHRRGQAPLPQ
jgi:NAD(P)H-hydrate repair Nnr-like enzyme with NAD(P)H-hydrate epimerase domain